MSSQALPTKTPTERELRVKKYVQEFMRKSSKFRESYERDWERALSEYLNTRSVKQNMLQRANLKIPYAFTTVETFVPQITEAFLGDRPYIQAMGRGVEDLLAAENISEHLSYQLDQTGFFSKFVVFAKSLVIYGTSVSKVIWSVKENGFDGPEVTNIELQDFYIDWGATIPGDIESMRGCVHRVYRTLSEIKSRRRREENGNVIGVYKNIEELERSVKDRGTDAWVNMSKPADDRLSQAKENYFNQDSGAKTNDKIELWEYWGIFDPKGDGNFVDYVITLANGEIVLRDEDNPLDSKEKPFAASVCYPIMGEFYGVGVILPILSLIKEGTALRNARLDQTNQAVNRMWLVDRNSGINVRNLYSRPGGIVLANDINGIKPLEAPESGASASRETAQIDYDIQNATAQTNASQSVSNIGRAFGRTATGVNFMQSASASRLSLIVRLIEDLYIKRIGHKLLSLNKQFQKTPVWVRLYNSENPFTQLDPESFNREYDMYAVGAMNRLNKQERRGNFQQVIVPYLQAVEQAQPMTIKWDNLTRRLFKEFEWRDVNELVTTQEERQQLMQQAQQSQMQAEQQAVQNELAKESELKSQETRSKSGLEDQKSANKAGITIVKGLVDGLSRQPTGRK